MDYPPPENNRLAEELNETDLDALTAQERKILRLAAEDLTNKEIASRLGIAEKTVKCHRKNTYKKLGIHTRVQIRKLLRWFNTLRNG